MYNFDFEKPSTIADAVSAMTMEEAQALGGGQTLIPTLKQRLASPSKLVSLSGIAEMKGCLRSRWCNIHRWRNDTRNRICRSKWISSASCIGVTHR